MHASQTPDYTILKFKINHNKDLESQKIEAINLISTHIELMKTLFDNRHQHVQFNVIPRNTQLVVEDTGICPQTEIIKQRIINSQIGNSLQLQFINSEDRKKQ